MCLSQTKPKTFTVTEILHFLLNTSYLKWRFAARNGGRVIQLFAGVFIKHHVNPLWCVARSLAFHMQTAMFIVSIEQSIIFQYLYKSL
jgi:hypothetical protein